MTRQQQAMIGWPLILFAAASVILRLGEQLAHAAAAQGGHSGRKQIAKGKQFEVEVSALKSGDPRVRQAAANTLGEMADPRAVGPLVALLADSDKFVRLAAAKGLSQLGWRPSDETQRILFAIARLRFGEAAWIGSAAVGPLVDVLKQRDIYAGDVKDRARVAEALGNITDKRVAQALLLSLKDPEFEVRWAAKEGLEALESQLMPTVRELIPLLKAEEKDVRHAAAMLLGRLRDAQAIDHLVLALKDPDEQLRWRAAWALGEIGHANALESLAALLSDTCEAHAATALGKIRDARAVDPLLVALQGKCRWVHASVAWALGNIGDQRAAYPLLSTLMDTYEYASARSSEIMFAVAGALGKLGDPNVVDELLRVVKGLDTSFARSGLNSPGHQKEKRLRAAFALGLIDDPRKADVLATALKGDDAATAVMALRSTRDDRALDALMVALNGPDPSLRRAAAYSLGTIGDPRSMAPLIRALEDPDDQVRINAAQALGTIKSPAAVEPLVRTLRDRSDDVRAAAIAALGKIRDPRAVTSLIVLLEESAKGTADAMSGWASRKAAATALGAIGDPRAVPSLIKILTDSNVLLGPREAAAQALGMIGDARAIDHLVRALDDDQKDIRKAASSALKVLRSSGSHPPSERLVKGH